MTADHLGRRRRTLPRWGLATTGCVATAALAVLTLEAVWPEGPSSGFLAVVAGVLVLEATLLFRTIDRTRSAPLTSATWVTLVRGGTIAVLAGFLLAPTPTGPIAWAPAILFALGAGLDAIDGLLARATDSTTELGARLDVETDGLAVLVGAVVAVAADAVPTAFLAVGAARYLFVLGTWWRRRRGRPVLELPPSRVRRPLGALAMAAVWIALAPVPGRTISYAVGAAVMVPFLANFCRDWLAVCGYGRG
ncbi:CDP-alcohol phosphatidyltransferase family protein [Natronococcus occultus]|uniref:Phosphatidylglycerophosphate synthase n=1 Tax=Natronococcus occultus SP4 TaxID=694430 RepID=L0JYR7_9EURY|nr:CDP-alcohol phosphatidyltransferase family protein [Natronococcus occultus]AGB37445.1 phosphatidylglycerophosphate synthase [Natronococcus occultus SP4]